MGTNIIHVNIRKDDNQISLVARKPAFEVCDQGRLKPVCAATEAS